MAYRRSRHRRMSRKAGRRKSRKAGRKVRRGGLSRRVRRGGQEPEGERALPVM